MQICLVGCVWLAYYTVKLSVKIEGDICTYISVKIHIGYLHINVKIERRICLF